MLTCVCFPINNAHLLFASACASSPLGPLSLRRRCNTTVQRRQTMFNKNAICVLAGLTNCRATYQRRVQANFQFHVPRHTCCQEGVHRLSAERVTRDTVRRGRPTSACAVPLSPGNRSRWSLEMHTKNNILHEMHSSRIRPDKTFQDLHR